MLDGMGWMGVQCGGDGWMGWSGVLDDRRRLLELLLDAQLVGVAAFLLAAVHGTRMETSVAPEQRTTAYETAARTGQ